MILNNKIYNQISILITLNSLYNNFETIITNIFEQKNKIIDKI